MEEAVGENLSKVRSYSNFRILLQSFFLLIPFLNFDHLGWILWFGGTELRIPEIDPNESIWTVIFAPKMENLIVLLAQVSDP